MNNIGFSNSVGESPKRRLIKDDHLRGAVASTIGGFTAGCLGVLAGHPFDTLKTRLQVDNGKPIFLKNTSWYRVVLDLYRGILPPTLTIGLMASVNFFVYENTRKLLTRPEYKNNKPIHGTGPLVNADGTDIRAVWGGALVSGVISSLFAAPVSMIKVQQQVVSQCGMIATARELYTAHGGLRVFYRAYTPIFINETYGRGVYFFVYESCKSLFSKLLDKDTNGRTYSITEQHPLSSTLSVRMMSAAVAGVISWFSIYPFDVIKSKLQIDIDGVKYNHSVKKCFQITYQTSGISGLTRGLGYTLVRAVPVASTVLPIYEYARDALQEYL